MRTKDYTYGYKPIRILKRSAWEIAFCKMMDISVRKPAKDDLEGSFDSSMAASLESMKMWEMCDECGCSELKPHKASKKSETLFSYAVINVIFPDRIDDEDVKWMADSFKTWMEGLPEEEKKSDVIMLPGGAKIEREQADELLNNIETNQRLHERLKNEKPEADEKKNLKKERKATFNQCRKLLKWFITLFWDRRYYSSLRSLIYNEGFVCETVSENKQKYVLYKRSANKAKKGSCLFISDKLHDGMLDWTWLGLKVWDNKLDLTSARAYEALVSSSIVNTVSIKPENILLIDAVESPDVGGNIRIMILSGKNELSLLTRDEYRYNFREEYKNINKIWDGQALVDKSIFKAAGYYKKHDGSYDNRHGMMLLRNSFFKACAFNTNISDYYREMGLDENDKIKDMFGNEISALDVKMIVTPDSIKLFKFADTFFDGDREKAYAYWRENISERFGIVKEDNASHLGHGRYHEVSYQLLNTLPIREQEDIDQLLKKDMEYMQLIKTNSAVLMHRMRYIDVSLRKKFFIYTMFKYYREFKNTEYFKKNYLKEELDNYRDKLREGRLKLKGDFYYLCSMPYEMLEYSLTKKIPEPQLEGNQVYIRECEDNKTVTLIRYPHLNSGSVCSLINVHNENYDKWFNFVNRDGCNVVVVSPWNSNIMIKLGGADFDSDTALFVKDEIIERAAKELQNIKCLSPEEDGLPVGVADPDLKEPEEDESVAYNKTNMAALDNRLAISGKTIGQISNNIQLFNSYFWEEYFKGDCADEDKLKTIYECIMKLSVLNELAIDSAKHKLQINPSTLATKISSTRYNAKNIIQKTVVKTKDDKEITVKVCPYFLYESMTKHGKVKNKDYSKRSKGNVYEAAKPGEKKKQVNEEFWDCPMDMICKSLVSTENTGNWKGDSLDAFLKSITKDEEGMVKKEYGQIKKYSELLLGISDEHKKDNLRALEDNDSVDIDDQETKLRSLHYEKTSENVRIKLFKATFEKYETTKDGHRKGDYKNDRMSDPERRSRIWGILFALENIPGNENENPGVPVFLKNSGFCRKDLITESEYRKMDSKKENIDNWERLDLWGENWYYDKTMEDDPSDGKN